MNPIGIPNNIPSILSKYHVALMPYGDVVSGRLININLVNSMSPMKMFDYLSSGKLLISSDLPVLREILKHNHNSFLIKNYYNIFEWKKCIDNYNVNNLSKLFIMRKNAQELMKSLSWTNRAKKIIQN